jgi:hypothetical protein
LDAISTATKHFLVIAAAALLGAALIGQLALLASAAIGTGTGNVVSGPPIPPQAAARGYTTLARNSDFTVSADIDCEGAGHETQEHDWYTGMEGAMASSCGKGLNPTTNPTGPVQWPFTDPVTGDTVLNIHRTMQPQNSTSSGNMGGVLGRVGITSMSYHRNHGQKFPINLYVECTERVWPVDVMGMWSNCWGGGDGNPLEFDINEFHSSDPSNYGNPGATVWEWTSWSSCNAPCAMGTTQCMNCLEPNWLPSDYHKYGLLLYQTSSSSTNACGYLDDQKTGCFDFSLAPSHYEHGTSWLESLTSGGGGCCENSWAMVDVPITRAYFDTGQRTTAVVVNFTDGQTCCMQGNYGVLIQGTNTSADGYWSFTQNGSTIYLWGPRTTGNAQSQGGPAVPFRGNYSGGGTFNPLPKHAFNHSVKSFRIWACADWKTTQCSPYNTNNPYK